MISTKPYLVRAIREWAQDNNLTPQVLVDTTTEGVEVPANHVKDGQIVLNIADQAIQLQELGNEWLRFSARFQGRPYPVQVPIGAILAVYARENGQGIFFKEPDLPPEPGKNTTADGGGAEAASTPKAPRSHLKVVK